MQASSVLSQQGLHFSRENASGEGSPHALVAVPMIGEQISSSDLLPALQQLLSVYQVEYWALLEELRTQHSAVCPQLTAVEARASRSDSAHTMQQLWKASRASHQAVTPAPDPQQDTAGVAGAESQPSPAHQQEQGSTAPAASPFAAAAQPYGDTRCGFARDACDQQLPLPQQQQQQPQLLVPSLQQAEQLLQQLPAADAGAVNPQQLQEWRARFKAVAPSVAGLEQLASAGSLQYMDAQGGLACLCGQQGRWVLRRSAASLGRSTDAKGDVDIDLGQAAGDGGVGTKVSRLQAQLLLTADGSWSIHNNGRAPLAVNGTQVPRGSTVPLPHLSLLEVSDLPLLFMVNSMAVQRAVARSVHLAM